MKRLNIIVFILMIGLLGVNNVFAENCDSKTQVEVNAAAASVTMDYKIVTKVLDFDGNIHDELNPNEVDIKEFGGSYYLKDFITVNIENVTDRVFVVFSSIADNIEQEYHYEDLENGSLTYNVSDNSMTKDFTLKIYSNIGKCYGTEVNKIEIVTPKYNLHSDELICENNDAYYCKKYVTSDVEIPDEAYNEYAENNANESEEVQNTEEKSNFNKYLFIGGTVIIIILIILIIMTIIKNKKKREMINIGGE